MVLRPALGRPQAGLAAAALSAAALALAFGPRPAGPQDQLNTRQIPDIERPAEPRDGLVGVLGGPEAHPRRHVCGVAVSPGGGLVAAGLRCGAVQMWDADGWRLVWERPGHGAPVGALAFTPDARALFSGGRDGSVRRWGPGAPHVPPGGAWRH